MKGFYLPNFVQIANAAELGRLLWLGFQPE
jgi:hypothetical protein